MIKYALLIIAFWCAGTFVHGQYREDSWTISPKISFADYSDQKRWEDYSISKVPPLSVFAEKGINNFLSAGGFIGYNGDKYSNDTIPDNVMQYRTYMTGAVASVHYAHWIEQLSGHRIFLGHFDFYISGAIQLAINTTNEQRVWQADKEVFSDHKSSDAQLRIRPIFGIRYFITDRFCMLLEAGRGNPGMITTGVSWSIY